MNPLVSVVVPVFNGEAFVTEAIESALAQDYEPKEVIVVDDGSTDGSLAVIQHFGDAVHLIKAMNGGPARARNIGMRAARGDYIAFLDADDVWLPGKIAAQVSHLESTPDVGACTAGWIVWSPQVDGRFVRPSSTLERSKSVRVDETRSGWIYNRLLLDCEMLTTTVMIRSTVARKVGEFSVELPVGEDYDYWLRLSHQAKITRLACVGALYRVLPTSASRRVRETNFEHVVIRSAIERFGVAGPDGIPVDTQALEQRLQQLVFQHGYLHLKSGDPRIALRSFTQNLRARPWQARLWAYVVSALVVVVAGRHSPARS